MFILKMQKNYMMICCFFWSAAQLNYPAERKNINCWGYIMMLWSHFVSTLKLIYSEKATKFDEITKWRKKEGDFVKFLWPSQKTSTMIKFRQVI